MTSQSMTGFWKKPDKIITFISLSITTVPTVMAEAKAAEGPFSVPNWSKIFFPETPLLEIFLRGTFIYLSLFILLRVILKREAGTLGMTDLLVIVLLADASQNAIADDYKSITDGILLVATIIFWSHMINYLGYTFPFIQKFISPPPLLLVKNGRIIHSNMRKEFVTKEELMSQVREQGIGSLEEVSEAYMESDGHISVLKKSGEPANGSRKKKAI